MRVLLNYKLEYFIFLTSDKIQTKHGVFSLVIWLNSTLLFVENKHDYHKHSDFTADS